MKPVFFYWPSERDYLSLDSTGALIYLHGYWRSYDLRNVFTKPCLHRIPDLTLLLVGVPTG